MKLIAKKFIKIFSTGLVNILRTNIFLLLFLLLTHTLNAQNFIKGKASSYKGDVLYLYTIDDRITFSEKLLDTAKVDENGNFEFHIKLTTTRRVFVDLPTVKAYFYVEPNINYQLRLPIKQELTTEQKLNPGFEKEEIPALVIAQRYELNHRIAYFNNFFAEKRMAILLEKNRQKKIQLLDTLKIAIDTFMQQPNNQFFADYKTYNFALLHFAAIQAKRKFYIDSFLLKKPVNTDNPEYMMFFKQLFQEYLSPDNELLDLNTFVNGLKSADFQVITQAIVNGYTPFAKDTLLTDLLAINMMFNLFYTNETTQNDIITILQKIQKSDADSIIIKIATNFLTKATKLRENYPAPDFELLSKKHKIKTLKDFSDDFVYLNFFNPQSYGCMQQIELLKKYYQSNIKNLKIVTIFVGNNIDEMNDFLKNHRDYKWTFLFVKYNSDMIKKYNIVSFPTYYLIYPDGKLVSAETPAPTENFEAFYNQSYKKWQKISASENK